MNTITSQVALAMSCERRLILERVRRLGGITSDALLDPACKIFTLPNIDGLIGYREDADCVVVFGDPVCKATDLAHLTEAFHRYIEEKGMRVIYISASESFTRLAFGKFCKVCVEFGEELMLDPVTENPRERHGTHASLVRRKIRHAQHDGTQVIELTTHDPALEQAINQVGISWLESRKGPQIHISSVRLFEDKEGKRWFYAKHKERIVGVVVLNQLQARKGWLLNHLMITPDAPHGTPELLVITALEKVAIEDCHLITFGTVIKERLGVIEGFGKIHTLLLRGVFNTAKLIFHLSGPKKFWEKFHPRNEPTYLLFSQPYLGIREIRSVMKALNVL